MLDTNSLAQLVQRREELQDAVKSLKQALKTTYYTSPEAQIEGRRERLESSRAHLAASEAKLQRLLDTIDEVNRLRGLTESQEVRDMLWAGKFASDVNMARRRVENDRDYVVQSLKRMDEPIELDPRPHIAARLASAEMELKEVKRDIRKAMRK